MAATAERTRGIPEERLQEILDLKDPKVALEACTEHGYAECWALIDGCMVVYNLDDPPRWLIPVLEAQDEDGNTPEPYMVPPVVEATDHLAHDPRFVRWLEDHGIDPKITYRVEVSRVAESIRVYQYATESGRPYFDAEKGAVKVRDPFDVPLKTLDLPVVRHD